LSVNADMRGGLSTPTDWVNCGSRSSANGWGRRGSRAGDDSAVEADGVCPQRFPGRTLRTDNRQSKALAIRADATYRTLGALTSEGTAHTCKAPYVSLLLAPLSWARHVGTQVPYAPTVAVYLLTESAEALKMKRSKSPSLCAKRFKTPHPQSGAFSVYHVLLYFRPRNYAAPHVRQSTSRRSKLAL